MHLEAIVILLMMLLPFERPTGAGDTRPRAGASEGRFSEWRFGQSANDASPNPVWGRRDADELGAWSLPAGDVGWCG